MKRVYPLLLPVILFLFSFSQVMDDKLTGHWVTIGNQSADIDFTADGHFKVMVNGNIENEGKYTLSKDVFSMYDNNCGMQVEGKYKLTFFTSDSLSFTLIADSCINRNSEVNGGVIKRIK
jgi:hypothetical protein